MWLDEAVSANAARNLSYSEIITKFSPTDFHPPLYYLTLKTWGKMGGYSDISIRMLSIVFLLITVYVVYLIGGTWPALIAGINPLFLYYSQEVRMYSMVAMFLTICLYFFFKKKYFWFNVFAFLSFLTFYGSMFFLLAFSVYLFLKKDYKKIVVVNIGLFLAIIILSPLLIEQIKNAKNLLIEVKNWNLVLGKTNLKNLLLIPIKFTSGRISFYPKIFYYLVSGIWAGIVFLSLKLNKFSLFFIIPLAGGFVFSFFSPMLQYFRFLYLIPILCLMIKRQKLVAGGFLIFSLIYLINPQLHREDWKSLSTDLKNQERVYMIETVADPIKFYRNDIEIKDLRSEIFDREITVIPFAVEIHGFNYQTALQEKGYQKIGEKSYRELKVEKWEKVSS